MNGNVFNHIASLTTHKLSVGYLRNGKPFSLQKELNLRLFDGDLVCLVGPNGCGKSTLIRTLAGIQPSLEGQISILNEEINSISQTDLSRKLNIVLTEKTVVDQITVEEVVALGRYNETNWLGTLTPADINAIDKALEAVKLTDLRNRAYYTLSDGERQRAFIGKALASNAPIMLLDEPTAHLDIINRVEILSLLRHLTRQTGHAVLVSTHELDLATQLADELWVMQPGGTIHIGTPEEIMHSGILDRIFGNEMVQFNPGYGSFTIRKNFKYSIQVEGDNPQDAITRQAIERLGFSTENNKKSIARIVVKNNTWSLYSENDVYSHLSLPDICRLVKEFYSSL